MTEQEIKTVLEALRHSSPQTPYPEAQARHYDAIKIMTKLSMKAADESLLGKVMKELRSLTPEQLRAGLKKHENSDIAVALRQLNQTDCPACQGSGEDPEGYLDGGGPDACTVNGPCRHCGGKGTA